MTTESIGQGRMLVNRIDIETYRELSPRIPTSLRKFIHGPMPPTAAKWFQDIVTVLERQPHALESKDEWLKFPNLILTGETGVGKSVTAAQVIWRLAELNNRMCQSGHTVTATNCLRCQWLNWPEYMLSLQASPSEWEYHTEADFLVLDDIGFRFGGWKDGLSREHLYAVSNARWESCLPTIATMNSLTEDEQADVLGDRVVSRLFGGATVVELSGDDRRFE